MTNSSSCWRILIPIWLHATVLTFVMACTRDPYGQYARLIGRDVDGTTGALENMRARVQHTVVQNDIPFDSLKVWWEASEAAAETVRKRSADFADVTAPSELADMHGQIGGTLASIEQALQAEAALFSACTKGIGRGVEAACRANIGQNYPGLAETLATAGEDLRLERARVQHLLSVHGVLLPESALDSGSEGVPESARPRD